MRWRESKKWAGKAQRKELVNSWGQRPISPKGKDMVIGPRKPKGFSQKTHKSEKGREG